MAENRNLQTSSAQTKAATGKSGAKPRSRKIYGFPLSGVVGFVLRLVSIAVVLGGLVGYRSTIQSQACHGNRISENQPERAIQPGNRGLSAGRYEVARQRLEYVITQDHPIQV